MLQKIRFVTSFDGAKIAYSVSGEGPPVVMLPSWLTHLEYQPRSVAWQPWLDALSKRYTLIRYDPRGCGLSDRNTRQLSLDMWVRDLAALADALDLTQFSLVGICQGGAIALEYASRAPERVSHLVLYGAYARGRDKRSDIPLEPEKARLMLEMLEMGWGQEDHAFMRAFATQFQPDGPLEHLQSWCELQSKATSASGAVAMTRIMFDLDAREAASRIKCPTLVAHAERDAVVPLAEGLLLARIIPGARFLQLDSRNHFMLAREPEWKRFVEELHAFLPSMRNLPETFADLTPRESEVMRLISQGLDNDAISRALAISEKTVRNHVTSIFSKLGATSRAHAVALARDARFGG
jgi:pimeloyl-ACP methyl ester carboxylesterase/DNA-binding CsgD family transcriptional regulator